MSEHQPASGQPDGPGSERREDGVAAPMPASRRVVEVTNLVKGFRRGAGKLRLAWSQPVDRTMLAVNRVSFHVAEDEIVGLVGESGSGKTTLGKTILRLYDVDEGTVLLEGQDIHRMDRKTLKAVRPRYQMIFQNPLSSLNPGMRVWDMLEETVSLHLKLKGLAAAERIADILWVVQLTDKGNAYPSQLSGGERRRVGLARVLLLKPRLIVADEPTAGLDASLKAGIVNLMLETRAPGMAYLFISHDLHLIRYVANRILVMLRGRLIEVVPEGGFELGLPHHPYTELLLQSLLARHDRPEASLSQLLPVVESLGQLEGSGCCYYTQCSRARRLGPGSERCKAEAPELAPAPGGGSIACHFASEE